MAVSTNTMVVFSMVWECVCARVRTDTFIFVADSEPVFEITEITDLELFLAIAWWLEIEN